MDFFHPGVISKAISTAANCCGSINLDNFELVKSELSTLMSLLHREEKTELETSILCFSNLIQSITTLRSVSGLETISSKGLMRTLTSLLERYIRDGDNSNVSFRSYSYLIKIITTCITHSSKLLEEVVNQGIISKLANGMEKLVKSNSKTSDPQTIALLDLTDKLFPELPIDFIPINYYENYIPRRYRFPLKDPLIANQKVVKNVSNENVNDKEEMEDEENLQDEKQVEDPQEIFFKKTPSFLLNLGTSIITHLIKFNNSSVNPDIRDRSLIIILKFLYFSDSETLCELLKDVPISNFISNLLSSSEIYPRVIAVLMSNLLMEKLPEIFSKYFKRGKKKY